jgi:hypothetical protein
MWELDRSLFGLTPPRLQADSTWYTSIRFAAGTLIGLQVVVITAVRTRPALLRAAKAGSAFATPTIVHFGTALPLSAVLRVPWRSIIPAATILRLR